MQEFIIKTGKYETVDPSWGKHFLPREIAKLAYEAGWTDAKRLLVSISVCIAESNGYERRKYVNPDGSVDRGLWQINNKSFPNISDDIAFNAVKATRFARQIYVGRNNMFTAWQAFNNGQYKDARAMGYALDGVRNMLALENGFPV